MKLLLVFACFTLTACVTTNYHTWEGGTVTAGDGGAKRIVDSMEIWISGKPSRKHKVIGYIEDERGAGLIPRHALFADLVEVAKQKGGEAVVLLSSDTEVSGITNGQGSYNAFTNTVTPGATTVHRKITTKALVIDYID